MFTYASVFITGFAPLVVQQLNSLLPNVRILKILDGLVVYKTTSTWEKLAKLGFFSNTYLLIAETSNIDTRVLKALQKQELKLKNLLQSSFIRSKTFRVVISKNGEMPAINENLRRNLEQGIATITKMLVDRNKPDVEFWFILRTESYGFFGLRLTKHADYKKILPAGELRPELANLLCLMSKPEKTDVFVDLFSGYGSIPQQRSTISPYTTIIANDIDAEKTQYLKRKLGHLKNVKINLEDALNLPSILSESIDKIVTDPPWGYYDNKNTDFNIFYVKMLETFCRILKPKGIAVVLTAKKDEFTNAINKTLQLQVDIKYDILVSGKKAVVYRLIKR